MRNFRVKKMRRACSRRTIKLFFLIVMGLGLSLFFSGSAFGVNSDWIIMSNSGDDAAEVNLFIAGELKGVYSILPGHAASYYASGSEKGPIQAVSINGQPIIVSQRDIFKSGFDETMAIPAAKTGSKNFFTWYDNNPASGVNEDIILIGNTDSANAVYYEIQINGAFQTSGIIPPGGLAEWQSSGTLTGGPVIAEAWTDPAKTVPANITVSQRVFYKDSYSEVFSAAYDHLDSAYYFSWYDQGSPGANDRIMITNPDTTAVNFDINIAGVAVKSGTIAAGQSLSETFPGILGGPVVVKAYQPGGDWSNPSERRPVIASQRIVWGNSFTEVTGIPFGEIESEYYFPWYDQVTPDMNEWIIVGNRDPVNTVSYEIRIAGAVVQSGHIPPSGLATLAFPGLIGGPVTVSASGPVLATERILYNGSFTEVSGMPLSSQASENFLSSIPVCSSDQPSLKLKQKRIYWSSLSDFLNRRVTVDFDAENSGGNNAINVSVNGSTSTNGVSLLTAMPVSLGRISPGSSAPFKLAYRVPLTTYSFTTATNLSAEDKCGNSFNFSFANKYQVPLLPMT